MNDAFGPRGIEYGSECRISTMKYTRLAFLRAVAAAWLCLAGSAAADAERSVTPFEFRAVYDVAISGFNVARMERRLERTEAGYVLVSISEASGLARLFNDDRLEERSTLIEDAGRLRVARYDYLRTGDKKKQRQVEFAPERHLITGLRDGRSWEVTLAPDQQRVFDRHAYQLFISLEVAKGVQTLHYPIADNGRLKTLAFRRVGREQMRVSGREVETLKLERDVEGPEGTEIWLAEDFGYLPVRVVLRDGDGRRTTFELDSFEGAPPI